VNLKSGSQLGSFEIISLLGSGGMGEVYKAKDLKLGRTVAIKVLQKELASDPERLKRFEQEARSASALNHPNIITIYDISEHESTPYIAMEYVEGKTLRELLGTRELTLSKSLQYAVQIADGLARAHGQGIVHRDLKPDNVMVTEDGLVKILDFGLAKLMEPSDWTEASTRDLQRPHTQEGHVVGTAPYMSPEQAQGQKVDARSDIFSFGSVLYEMVTGRRAFAAKSIRELLTAIIREHPNKVSEVVPSVPLDLEKVITRALRKEPERRIQSMADVKIELQDIKEELESGSFVSADQVSRKAAEPRGKTWLWLAAAVVLITVVAASWLYFKPAADIPHRTIPLTSYPGEENDPVISPDGSQVAFVRVEGPDERDLYVKLIDGGEPVLISEGDIHTPAWSPDGNQIAFIRDVQEDGAIVRRIFTISALGGAERQITTSLAARRYGYGLSWSPDGNILAMIDRESPEGSSGIFLLSLETGEKRRLTSPPPGHDGDRHPRFSPDGGTVAFVRQRVIAQSDIYLVPVAGGEARRLTTNNRMTSGLDWTNDGRSIVFSASRSGRAGYFSLWRVSVSGGEPEPLGVGEHGVSPSLSRRGGRLSYAKFDRTWNLWRVGGPSAAEEHKSPTRFISSTWAVNSPQYSPDGRIVLYCSHRTGFQEIWICDSDGSNPKQLTFLEDPMTVAGNWSPDGQRIAFASMKEGSFDVYVIDATGGFPRRLTTETSVEGFPSWSNDGRWIYFTSDRTGRFELYKMRADGGEAVQITRNGGTAALESRDGQFLYFAKSAIGSGPLGIWRMPKDGGEESQIHDRGEFVCWDVLEQGICYLNRHSVPPAVELLDLTTKEVSQVAVLENRPTIYGFAVSPDGRWILYQTEENQHDIMLVENFR
jgi:serine/threonine protein kinase/Tol biopolymer transport system component